MKQNNLKKQFLEVCVISIFFFTIELIFRAIENFPIFSWATFRIFLSCFGIVSILSLVLSFCKSKKIHNEVWLFFLFLVTIYGWLQLGFHNFLGMYISIGTASQVGAITNYIRAFFSSYHWEYYLIFIPFLLYILFFIFPKKDLWSENILDTGKERLFLLFISLLLGGSYFSTLYIPFMQVEIQQIPNKNLFFSPTNSSIAVSQYGSTMYAMLDIKQFVFPRNILNQIELNEEEFIDDQEWLEILKEEKNQTYATLSSYFISRRKSTENDYTGYFEGMNVIVVMMESVNNAILNSEYFPNFSRILEHAWYWENNYSPRGSCATGDNEFSGLTSLYALNTTCTTNTYQDNTYFTSMFRRFKESGYKAVGFHDFDDTFYARSVYQANMGSEKYYGAEDLNIDYNSEDVVNWPNDGELMEKAVDILSQEEPFMAWITTVSAHLPYSLESDLGNMYFDLFEDTDYTTEVKRYMSKLKVTDDALGVLLDELEEKGLLENTVIVLYGDHYPYGLSQEEVSSIVDYDVYDFYEIERTPFVIYNSNLTPQIFSEKTSYINILPTLANLFHLEYDSRFYFGSDLLSDDFSGRVVFSDGSWEDEIARYDATNASITYLKEERYTLQEIQEINQEIYTEKEMSKLAITSNYFEYLENALDAKAKESEEEHEQINDSGITTQE